ncbi:MAG: DUF839 domain-containing protein [Cyanobacteria bacterium]|nr:DUF839 domain-containing protein [Cyanobacteria bacterium GSL.Bin1]
MPVSRRKFFFLTGATAVGTALSTSMFKKLHAKTLMSQARAIQGFGQLQPDPNGIFDLPPGFNYRVLSRTGQTMDDGGAVPTAPDGMDSYSDGNGNAILVRNHELSINSEDEVANSFKANPTIPIYDPGAIGGTATLTVGPGNRLQGQRRSLAGTENNCAGGSVKVNSRSSLGSWLSCEETIILPASDNQLQKRHGYVFEVPADAPSDAEPLRAMGRFLHESIAEDPETGYIYETNDDFNELGLYYRFRPNKVGDLRQGGVLEALVIPDMPGVDTTNNNEDTIAVGTKMPVEWVEVPVPDPEDNLQDSGPNNQRKIQHQMLDGQTKVRDVAALFNRTEGSWYDGEGGIVICATDAGPEELGQIWRLDVRNQTLELLAEPRNPEILQSPDNVTVAPWGDIIICEDGDGTDRLIGLTPNGEFYVLGRNGLNTAELAGANFSPDGKTLFLNAPQKGPGVTIAITGPWEKSNSFG